MTTPQSCEVLHGSGGKKEVMEGIPNRKEYLLFHYRQRSKWDCGLSCILMIIPPTSKQNFLDNFEVICCEEGFEQSTWTIDLCYILKKFNIRHLYLTKTIGVDPNYGKHSYYNKILTKDEHRVNLKFSEAPSKGILVEQKTVSLDNLLKHMAEHGPIILLTSSPLLACDICKRDKVKPSRRFSGHYIVLCGYDLISGQIFYRDPSQDDHVCISSFHSLDSARTAYGTDEDAILIFNHF